MSDPARRACADPDAREAGSLTPLSASHPLFSGRPGRQKAPADKDTDIGASIGSCEASQPRVRWGDDRPCTVVIIIAMVDGAAGPLAIVPPPRPPRVETWPRTEPPGEERRRPLNARRLDEIRRRYGVTIRERRTATMELSDFAIGETFWTHAGAFRCTDIGTRVVVAVKLGPREVSRAESVDGELRITKRIDDDPSWLNGPPYAIEELVFDENELVGCFRSEAELLGDGEDNVDGVASVTRLTLRDSRRRLHATPAIGARWL